VKLDNSPPRGTRDLLPAQVTVRDHALATISAVYGRYGYRRIETPAIENINRLQSDQGGENEKLIFQILKRGIGEVVTSETPVRSLVDLGLRFDLTVPLARYYGHNHASLPMPFRAFQAGPVFRAERPQKGRFRQFTQCDIDVIGEESVLAEVELIEATTDALAAVGLSDVVVRLSDRRFLTALAQNIGLDDRRHVAFFIALDKLDKIGWDGVADELHEIGIDAAALNATRERIESLLDTPPHDIARALANAVPNLGEDALADLASTAACLERLHADRGIAWSFDPTLVRGMGYYTGQIFEIAHRALSYSIAGGGRYDKLIGRSLGRDVPACGFSIGFERIVDLIAAPDAGDVVAILFEADVPLPEVVAVARRLRAQGRSAIAVRRSGKLGVQLSRLEESGVGSYVNLRSGDTQPDEKKLGGSSRQGAPE
jgi:histidyl-tRNA synthetase